MHQDLIATRFKCAKIKVHQDSGAQKKGDKIRQKTNPPWSIFSIPFISFYSWFFFSINKNALLVFFKVLWDPWFGTWIAQKRKAHPLNMIITPLKCISNHMCLDWSALGFKYQTLLQEMDDFRVHLVVFGCYESIQLLVYPPFPKRV